MTAQSMNNEYEQPLEKPLNYKLEDAAENDDTEVTEEISSAEFSQEEPSRKITFYHEVEECEIPSREDMSDEECYLCYYSPDEIAWMNQEQNETADRMEAGKKAKKATPYRGLEAWTQRGQHQMNQRIFSCVDSVLDEQDQQWQKQKSSTRKIAKASKSITKTSKKLALELAKQDEKDARKIYEQHLNDDDDVDVDVDQDEQQEEEQPHIPLRDMIRNSTIMKSKKKKMSSNRSLDGSSHSMDLGISMHSCDSCDSGFWSIHSTPSLLEKKPKKKKRKSKKKSAAREGKTPKETPAKTPASRRKKIKSSKAA